MDQKLLLERHKGFLSVYKLALANFKHNKKYEFSEVNSNEKN